MKIWFLWLAAVIKFVGTQNSKLIFNNEEPTRTREIASRQTPLSLDTPLDFASHESQNKPESYQHEPIDFSDSKLNVHFKEPEIHSNTPITFLGQGHRQYKLRANHVVEVKEGQPTFVIAAKHLSVSIIKPGFDREVPFNCTLHNQLAPVNCNSIQITGSVLDRGFYRTTSLTQYIKRVPAAYLVFIHEIVIAISPSVIERRVRIWTFGNVKSVSLSLKHRYSLMNPSDPQQTVFLLSDRKEEVNVKVTFVIPKGVTWSRPYVQQHSYPLKLFKAFNSLKLFRGTCNGNIFLLNIFLKISKTIAYRKKSFNYLKLISYSRSDVILYSLRESKRLVSSTRIRTPQILPYKQPFIHIIPPRYRKMLFVIKSFSDKMANYSIFETNVSSKRYYILGTIFLIQQPISKIHRLFVLKQKGHIMVFESNQRPMTVIYTHPRLESASKYKEAVKGHIFANRPFCVRDFPKNASERPSKKHPIGERSCRIIYRNSWRGNFMLILRRKMSWKVYRPGRRMTCNLTFQTVVRANYCSFEMRVKNPATDTIFINRHKITMFIRSEKEKSMIVHRYKIASLLTAQSKARSTTIIPIEQWRLENYSIKSFDNRYNSITMIIEECIEWIAKQKRCLSYPFNPFSCKSFSSRLMVVRPRIVRVRVAVTKMHRLAKYTALKAKHYSLGLRTDQTTKRTSSDRIAYIVLVSHPHLHVTIVHGTLHPIVFLDTCKNKLILRAWKRSVVISPKIWVKEVVFLIPSISHVVLGKAYLQLGSKFKVFGMKRTQRTLHSTILKAIRPNMHKKSYKMTRPNHLKIIKNITTAFELMVTESYIAFKYKRIRSIRGFTINERILVNYRMLAALEKVDLVLVFTRTKTTPLHRHRMLSGAAIRQSIAGTSMLTSLIPQGTTPFIRITPHLVCNQDSGPPHAIQFCTIFVSSKATQQFTYCDYSEVAEKEHMFFATTTQTLVTHTLGQGFVTIVQITNFGTGVLLEKSHTIKLYIKIGNSPLLTGQRLKEVHWSVNKIWSDLVEPKKTTITPYTHTIRQDHITQCKGLDIFYPSIYRAWTGLIKGTLLNLVLEEPLVRPMLLYVLSVVNDRSTHTLTTSTSSKNLIKFSWSRKQVPRNLITRTSLISNPKKVIKGLGSSLTSPLTRSFYSWKYKRYRTVMKAAVHPSNCGNCNKLLMNQLMKENHYFCSKCQQNRLAKRDMSDHKLCIHGIWGIYFWFMPSPNNFIIWNYQGSFMDLQPFVWYFNYRFYPGLWPFHSNNLKLDWKSLFAQPQSIDSLLNSDYRNYPLTFTLIHECVHIHIVVKQLPPITTTFDRVTGYAIALFTETYHLPNLFLPFDQRQLIVPSSVDQHFSLVRLPNPRKLTLPTPRPVVLTMQREFVLRFTTLRYSIALPSTFPLSSGYVIKFALPFIRTLTWRSGTHKEIRFTRIIGRITWTLGSNKLARFYPTTQNFKIEHLVKPGHTSSSHRILSFQFFLMSDYTTFSIERRLSMVQIFPFVSSTLVFYIELERRDLVTMYKTVAPETYRIFAVTRPVVRNYEHIIARQRYYPEKVSYKMKIHLPKSMSQSISYTQEIYIHQSYDVFIMTILIEWLSVVVEVKQVITRVIFKEVYRYKITDDYFTTDRSTFRTFYQVRHMPKAKQRSITINQPTDQRYNFELKNPSQPVLKPYTIYLPYLIVPTFHLDRLFVYQIKRTSVLVERDGSYFKIFVTEYVDEILYTSFTIEKGYGFKKFHRKSVFNVGVRELSLSRLLSTQPLIKYTKSFRRISSLTSSVNHTSAASYIRCHDDNLVRSILWLYVCQIEEVFQKTKHVLHQVVIAQLFVYHEIQKGHTKEKFFDCYGTISLYSSGFRRNWLVDDTKAVTLFHPTTDIHTTAVRFTIRFTTDYQVIIARFVAQVWLSDKVVVREAVFQDAFVKRVDVWMFRNRVMVREGHSLRYIVYRRLTLKILTDRGTYIVGRGQLTKSNLVEYNALDIRKNISFIRILVALFCKSNDVRMLYKISLSETRLMWTLKTDVTMDVERRMITTWYNWEPKHIFFHVVETESFEETELILQKTQPAHVSVSHTTKHHPVVAKFMVRIFYRPKFEIFTELCNRGHLSDVYLRGVVLLVLYTDTRVLKTPGQWEYGKTSIVIEEIHELRIIAGIDVVKKKSDVEYKHLVRDRKFTTAAVIAVQLLDVSKSTRYMAILYINTCYEVTTIISYVFKTSKTSHFIHMSTNYLLKMYVVSITTRNAIEVRHSMRKYHYYTYKSLLMVDQRFSDIADQDISFVVIKRMNVVLPKRVFVKRQFLIFGGVVGREDHTVKYITYEIYLATALLCWHQVGNYGHFSIKSAYTVVPAHQMDLITITKVLPTSAFTRQRNVQRNQIPTQTRVVSYTRKYLQGIALGGSILLFITETLDCTGIFTNWLSIAILQDNYEKTTFVLTKMEVYQFSSYYVTEDHPRYRPILRYHHPMWRMVSFKLHRSVVKKTKRFLVGNPIINFEFYFAKTSIFTHYDVINRSSQGGKRIIFSAVWVMEYAYCYIEMKQRTLYTIQSCRTESRHVLISVQGRETVPLTTAVNNRVHETAMSLRSWKIIMHKMIVVEQTVKEGGNVTHCEETEVSTTGIINSKTGSVLWDVCQKGFFVVRQRVVLVFRTQSKVISTVKIRLLADTDKFIFMDIKRTSFEVQRLRTNFSLILRPSASLMTNQHPLHRFRASQHLIGNSYSAKRFVVFGIWLCLFEYGFYLKVPYQVHTFPQYAQVIGRHHILLIQDIKTVLSPTTTLDSFYLTPTHLISFRVLLYRRLELTPYVGESEVGRLCRETEVASYAVVKYVASFVLVREFEKADRSLYPKYSVVLRTSSVITEVVTLKMTTALKRNPLIFTGKKLSEPHRVDVSYSLTTKKTEPLQVYFDERKKVTVYQFINGVFSRTGGRFRSSAVYLVLFEYGVEIHVADKPIDIQQGSVIDGEIGFRVIQRRVAVWTSLLSSKRGLFVTIPLRSYILSYNKVILLTGTVRKGKMVAPDYCTGTSTTKVFQWIASYVRKRTYDKNLFILNRNVIISIREHAMVTKGKDIYKFTSRVSSSYLTATDKILKTHTVRISYKKWLIPTPVFQFYVSGINSIKATRTMTVTSHKTAKIESSEVYTVLFVYGFNLLIIQNHIDIKQRSRQFGGVSFTLIQSRSTPLSARLAHDTRLLSPSRLRSYQILRDQVVVLKGNVQQGGFIVLRYCTGSTATKTFPFLTGFIREKYSQKTTSVIIIRFFVQFKESSSVSRNHGFRKFSYRASKGSFVTQDTTSAWHQPRLNFRKILKATPHMQYYVSGTKSSHPTQAISCASHRVYTVEVSSVFTVLFEYGIHHFTYPIARIINQSSLTSRGFEIVLIQKRQPSGFLSFPHNAKYLTPSIRTTCRAVKNQPQVLSSLVMTIITTREALICYGHKIRMVQRFPTYSIRKRYFNKGGSKIKFWELPEIKGWSSQTSNPKYKGFRWITQSNTKWRSTESLISITLQINGRSYSKTFPVAESYAGYTPGMMESSIICTSPREIRTYSYFLLVDMRWELGWESLSRVSVITLTGTSSTSQRGRVRLFVATQSLLTQTLLFNRELFYEYRVHPTKLLIRKLQVLAVLRPSILRILQYEMCKGGREMKIAKYSTSETLRLFFIKSKYKNYAITKAVVSHMWVSHVTPPNFWSQIYYTSAPHSTQSLKLITRDPIHRVGRRYVRHKPVMEVGSYGEPSRYHVVYSTRNYPAKQHTLISWWTAPYTLPNSGEFLHPASPGITPLIQTHSPTSLNFIAHVRSAINVAYQTVVQDPHGTELQRWTYLKKPYAKPPGTITGTTTPLNPLISYSSAVCSYVYERATSYQMTEVLYLPVHDDTGDYKECTQIWYQELKVQRPHFMVYSHHRIPYSKVL